MYYLLQEEIFLLKQILLKLTTQSNTADLLKYIIPFFLGTLSSVIGIFIGNMISKGKEKREFTLKTHLNYLKLLNSLIFDINNLIIDINNVKKFGQLLLKEEFNKLAFSTSNNYNEVVRKIQLLRQDLVSNVNLKDSPNLLTKNHYDYLMTSCDKLLDANIFIEILQGYEREGVNYLFFIDSKFKESYEEIVNIIATATGNNMNGFDIFNFKDYLVLHAKDVNKYIIHQFYEKKKISKEHK